MMNRQSDADQRIVDRLNAELSLIAIPDRAASRTVPNSGLRTAALLTATLAVLILAIGGFRTLRATPNGASTTEPQRTAPIARCSEGRPQAEIDFAGRMLWEPTANEISCVLNATVSGPGASRVYQLADGRALFLYERVEAVPAKPTVAPVATGSADVNGTTWSWSILPGAGQTLLLQGSLAGAPEIELYMALSDQAADLRLLRSIAASLREVATSTRPPNQAQACRSDQLSGTYEANGAASGSYGVSFRLAVATGSCEVPANPSVRFLDANGALILRSAASPLASGPVQTLRALAVGKDSGFLLVQWSGHGTEPGYRCLTMGPSVASVEVDLASVRGGTALVPSNVLTLNIPSAQRFGFCADPPERVSVSIVGSRQP